MGTSPHILVINEISHVIYNFGLHPVQQVSDEALLAFGEPFGKGSLMNSRRIVKYMLLTLILSSCLTYAQTT